MGREVWGAKQQGVGDIRGNGPRPSVRCQAAGRLEGPRLYVFFLPPGRLALSKLCLQGLGTMGSFYKFPGSCCPEQGISQEVLHLLKVLRVGKEASPAGCRDRHPKSSQQQ